MLHLFSCGMTSVYSGTLEIPACPTNTYVDIPLPSAFTYTGGALYIAYEWTYTGPYATTSDAAVGMINNNSFSSCYTASSNSNSTPVTMNASGFHPVYRFGTINTYTNDAEVLSVISPAQLHTSNSSTVHAVKAEIMNNSAVALTNLQVNLAVSGLVSHTDQVSIPSLAAGNYTTVTFSSYSLNPAVSGVNTISVSVTSDENNANNLQTWTQSVNCNTLELAPHLQSGSFLNRLNFNYLNDFYLLNKLVPKTPLVVSGINIDISDDVNHIGNTVLGVIINSLGNIVSQSNSVTLTASDINTYVTFPFPNPVNLASNATYYFGLFQPANNSVLYPPLALTPSGNVLPMDNNWYMCFGPITIVGLFQRMPSAMGMPAIELVLQGTCLPSGVNTFQKDPSSIRCFPNPAKHIMTITLIDAGTNNNLDISNILGEKVGEIKTIEHEVNLDMSGFSPGVYFLKTSGGSLNASIHKFVVEP